ncbi:MAG: hypothetical protein KA715_00470 [Xanthomonadaceae bacterium]|nr:hypothetical protein [Xanthomonadaceae bacterium]
MILVSVFLSISAHAFVPPFTYVLDKSADKKNKVKFLELTYQVTAFQDQRPTSVQFKESFLFDLSKDMWMSEARDDQQKVLFTEKKKISDDATALATLLQFDSSSERIQRSLNKMGFKVDRSKLDRMPPTVAWSYGQNIQLWFEKDEFIPFRWSHPNSKREKGNPIEIQFSNYKNHKEIIQVPQTITVSTRGQTLFVADLKQIIANDRKAITESGESGWSTDGESSSPVMKELIERYYTHIR